MSDLVWQAIIAGTVTIILALIQIWAGVISRKALNNVAKEVKDTSVTLKTIEKVGKDTHTLVNSNMGIQLKLGMDLSEFKAITTKLPEDIAAANLARSMYQEHVKKQNVVDRRS